MMDALIKRLVKNPWFRFFASLKLAVISILSLSIVLGVATVLESMYGTRAVYLLVYGTYWFYGQLLLLGINVLCAALSRYPWKRSQTGFVVTHFGILVLLFGSFLTMQFGTDGNLPVEEGNLSNEVSLSGLSFSIYDEQTNKRTSIPFPETAFAKKGDLFSVQLGDAGTIEVTEFLPRVSVQSKVKPSPVEGMGLPAIEVELSNSRFKVHEWLMSRNPDKPTEVDLGPAKLAMSTLWSSSEVAKFLKPRPKPKVDPGFGFINAEISGRIYRIDIRQNIGKWYALGVGGLEIKIDRYLPYAIVEKNKLVSKSSTPTNPAVQLVVRNQEGIQEKHTVFAFFPEFSTLHRSHGNSPTLGVGLKMVSVAQQKENKGRLEFAQLNGTEDLYYRVYGRDGELNSSGAVKVGTTVATGWMDLSFKVSRWIPHAVRDVQPRYIHRLEGNQSSFLSSLTFRINEGRELASQEDQWLLESNSKIISVGGKKYTIRLDRNEKRLPFAIALKKFTIGTNPGTDKAGSYESLVEVKDPNNPRDGESTISMNEPITHGGYTFYQASYQMRDGLPPVSVFSVNFDPGRWIKYAGSIFLCLGIGLMFWMNPHYWGLLFGSGKK